MSLLEIIKSFIKPSKRLERGYLYFIILIVLIQIFLSFNAKYLMREKKYDISKFQKEIKEFRESKIQNSDENGNLDYYDQLQIKKYDTLKLFSFNPNIASSEEFKALGFSEKQTKIILNYRTKGGKFKVKRDFSKIYCISDIQYEKLKEFIELPEYSDIESTDNEFKNVKKIELFEFDPNTASQKDFLRLGLSEKQINTIDNYLSKGGKFKNKLDFKKIYVISEEDYLRLENYINIEDEIKFDTQSKTLNNDKITKEIEYTAELNTATEEDLIKVKGIGKFSAKKIVEYRTQLGGYVKIQQLKEVSAIYENNYLIAKEYLTVEPEKVNKINLNFADFKQLIQHPYLEKEDVLKILKYRDKKGKIKNINELLDENILPKALFLRIEPYIKI